MMKRLFLCLPLYSRQVDIAVAKRFFLSKSHQVTVERFTSQSSLLAHGFNKQWLAAIQGDFDYFLMLHGDVEPIASDWIDTLLDEMRDAKADILSVVIPLKDSRGLTSTAVGVSQWKRRRLTLSEVAGLPTTFGAADIGGPLLINTGCMLVRLGGGWQSKVRFEINDRIEDGELVCEPEDWSFSRMAAENGARIFATSAVKVRHYGDASFPNWTAEVEQCQTT